VTFVSHEAAKHNTEDRVDRSGDARPIRHGATLAQQNRLRSSAISAA
jgi:hypothetical protein